MTEQGIGAGWYPNPDGPGNRYWDGIQWTSAVTAPSGAPGQGGSFTFSASFPRTETSMFAILAIIFPFVFAPLGVVFGILGLREIKQSNGQKAGRGLAIAGIWCGAIFSVFAVVWIVFVFTMMTNTMNDMPFTF